MKDVDREVAGDVRVEGHYGRTLLVAEVCQCNEGVGGSAPAKVYTMLLQEDVEVQPRVDRYEVGDARVYQTHVMLRMWGD